MLEVVGSNPALAKLRIKFLGLLRAFSTRQGSLPARLGLLTVSGVTGLRKSVSAAVGIPVEAAI